MSSDDLCTLPQAPKNTRKVLLAVIVSNVLLLFGALLFIVFVIRDIRRDLTAFLVYWLAISFFFSSGMVQLILDMHWLTGWASFRRPTGMGRYSDFVSWNLVVTILFLAGVTADIVAFVFWSKGAEGVPTEKRIQWFSSHLWLLGALITILLNWNRKSTKEDVLDMIGNYFFLFEAITNASGRYMNQFSEDNFQEQSFELAAASFWVSSAFCYVCGDIIRWRKNRKQSSTSNQLGMMGP
jgi:hypothetical protein